MESLPVYVAAFGLAALACFASVGRARRLEDDELRRGLVWLLVTSGGWSLATVAYLLAPTPGLARTSYVVGLIVGLATVGPWLYFCSAYTGRTLHRNPTFRWLAVAVFLALVAAKVTNPWHHLYFTATYVRTPFPHLAVRHGTFHWITMGLSYALTAVGYFMLLELFTRTSVDTRVLGALVVVTGLPVGLDVLGAASPWLLEIPYEPLGVAAFAVGVLGVFVDRFQTIRVAGALEEPVIFLDGDGLVRDYNALAGDLFPDLTDAVGRSLSGPLPAVAASVDSETPLEVPDGDGTRYYRVTSNQFTAGQTKVGRMLRFTDVTESERHRAALERENERLERFASVVSHDLRNPLQVARGRLDLLANRDDGEHVANSEHDEHVRAIDEAHERMEQIIGELLALAREGRAIEETEPVDLRTIAAESWEVVETGSATLAVEADGSITADRSRLRHLLENLFRNAVEHSSTSPDSQTRRDAVEHSSTSPDSQ
ncbi:MAG: histidine kinase N-terminal 7TM domain-containing protein, partial [Haloarculaceae archaeon]